MVFLHPSGSFPKEPELEARIQIDNSLRLGWNASNLMLITNFPFEYNGIKALTVGIEHFVPFRPRSTNTAIVPFLCHVGVIEEGELYWIHDLDAHQLQPIPESELALQEVDLGLTTYGWSPKWCLGSFFLRRSTRDIFELLKETIYENEEEDERAMRRLTKSGAVPESRYKTLNITYNFGMRQVGYNYQIADKPIRVAHFHPFSGKDINTIDVFLRGKNELGFPLVTQELIQIFKDHGVK